MRVRCKWGEPTQYALPALQGYRLRQPLLPFCGNYSLKEAVTTRGSPG